MPQVQIDTHPYLPSPIITGADTVPGGGIYRRPQGVASHVLIFTVAGCCQVGEPEALLEQQPGDLLLIEPERSLSQDTPAQSRWRRLWAVFNPRPHWYDWLDWPIVQPGYRLLRVPDVRRKSPVRASLEAMHRHAVSARRLGGESAMNALEAALIGCDAHNPRSAQARLDSRIMEAMDYISRHFSQPLGLDVLAHAAGLSRPHLTRLFRQQLGLSPMQFVERQRMQRACQLLELTAQPIGEIAAQVGFDDPFYFSTRFRHSTGTAPRAYRAGKRRAVR